VTAVAAVAAAVVAGSLFPHLQIVPCEFKPPHPPEARQGPICQKAPIIKFWKRLSLCDYCLTVLKERVNHDIALSSGKRRG
jgi:hypothetical protein